MRSLLTGSLFVLAFGLSGCSGYRHTCPGGCPMGQEKMAQMQQSHQEMTSSISQTRAVIASARTSNNPTTMRDALTRADNELQSIENKMAMAKPVGGCPGGKCEYCPHH